VHHPDITILPLSKPIPLEVADGRNFAITKAAVFDFTVGSHTERLVAYITDLGYYKLILGLP